MKKITLFFWGLIVVLTSCNQQPQITHIEGIGLGTYYKITIADKTNITQLQIDSVIAEVNSTASIFNPNSLVSRINKNETDSLNQILRQILEVSFQVCNETDGAFDFTVGALVNLWGFGKDAPKEVAQEKIDKALETLCYKNITVTSNRIIKENPSTQLNFNAIAKGYSVDLVAAFLSSSGIENFIVDIGGELLVRGKRAPNKLWRVGIQKPTETKESAIASEEIMELQDIAVATSGNYRNYIEKEGKRYGHTINPHTGYPESNNLLSVTVMASTCTLADAYATAFMVMGEERAKAFLEQHKELKAFFITVPREE